VTSNGTTRLALPPRAVDVLAIERALAQLWQQPPDAPDQAPLTQACMSNLLVLSADPREAGFMADNVATIVERHPARVLLLVPDVSDLVTDIEAYVSAQCHVGDGGRQVCSEYVTVSARKAASSRLPSVARPLLVGDLPTTLWWASATPPGAGGNLFTELAGMARQVIYDSRDWTKPVENLADTARWARETTGVAAADLAWRRAKPWRRLMSQALDPSLRPGALGGIDRMTLEHGPHGFAQTALVVGWLATCLGWQPRGGAMTPGVQTTWELEGRERPVQIVAERRADAEPDLQSVVVDWTAGGRSDRLRFTWVGTGRLGVYPDDAATPQAVLATPAQTRALLVARQLPVLQADPIFRRSLAVAGALARGL